MIKSAEIRWIFPGDPPTEILETFLNSNLKSKPAYREDTYLMFSSSTTVGVKLRESKFEIKPLIKSLGKFEICDGVVGLIELWEKWSCNAQEIQLFNEAAIKEDNWAKVGKERCIRKFIPKTNIKEVLADSAPDEGCIIELTKIKFKQKNYWSLAFETFGRFNNPEIILKKVLRYFFDEILTKVTFGLSNGKEGSFNLNNSCSYPLWLQKHQFDQ